jgi:excisionase family DNA binding protein
MDQITSTATARLYHVEEAASILSIGRTKAYELIATGRLHAIRLGRATRVSSTEIERFIRSVDRPEHTPPRRQQRQSPTTGTPSLFDSEPA